MAPLNIQAVLFDLDGTLRHNLPTGLETVIEFLKELGYTVPDERLPGALRWTHYYWSVAPERLAIGGER